MHASSRSIGTIAFLSLLLAACTVAPSPDDSLSSSSSSAASSAVAVYSPSSASGMVVVTSPQPGDTVTSPLTVTGEARGNWYFEASFPVQLLDGNGNQLAMQPAQAQGDWMTTDFVPFSVTLTFPAPATTTGTLILHRDNASGEPQFDASMSIPVSF